MQNVFYKRKKFQHLVASIAIALLSCSCTKEVYPDYQEDFFIKLLGKDYTDYNFLSVLRTSPTVGHVYFTKKGAGPEDPKPATKSQTIASLWLPSNTNQEESDLFFSTVIKTTEGPSVFVTENISQEKSLNLTSPVRSILANLGLGVNQDDKITINVKIDKLLIKEILWFELNSMKGKLRRQIRKLLNEELGDIVIVDKAIIIEGYESLVTINNNSSTNTDVKLDALLNQTQSGFNWTKESHGKYKATTNKQMVVAVLFSVPDKDPTRSSNNGLIPIKLSKQELEALTQQH